MIHLPRTSEQNEAIRKLRKLQIIQAGLEVYLEKGVLGMEMGDVATRAGLGRGTVYHYYNNKLDLLKDIFLQRLESSNQLIAETLKSNGRPIERLELFYLYLEKVLILF